MTQYYEGNNGQTIKINIAGNKFLTQLTIFLWDKIGIARPLSEMDCLLIARILKNYVKLSEYFTLNKNDFWGINKYLGNPQTDTLVWLQKKIIPFFESCEGIK